MHAVSDAIFYTITQELKLSVFRPKKNECDVCVGYRSRNEVYNQQQILKEEARFEKENNKQCEITITFTLDVQSVFLSPKTNFSAMYYKIKLIIHKLTVYNLQSKEGYSCLSNESEGKTTAQKLTSILIYF